MLTITSQIIKNFDPYSISGTIILLTVLSIMAIYANSLNNKRRGGRYNDITKSKKEKSNK